MIAAQKFGNNITFVHALSYRVNYIYLYILTDKRTDTEYFTVSFYKTQEDILLALAKVMHVVL